MAYQNTLSQNFHEIFNFKSILISCCDLFMYFFLEIIFWQCSVFVFCCGCFVCSLFVPPGTLSCNFAQSAECDRWLDLKLGAARELLGSKLAVCAVGPRGSRQRAVLCAVDQGLQPHETPEGVHLRELCTGHGSSSFVVTLGSPALAGQLPLFVPSLAPQPTDRNEFKLLQWLDFQI